MLTRYLYANAGYEPDRDALVYGDRRITHAELLERVERMAEALRERGIRAGDAVGLVLPNGPALATAFLALTGIERSSCRSTRSSRSTSSPSACTSAAHVRCWPMWVTSSA